MGWKSAFRRSVQASQASQASQVTQPVASAAPITTSEVDWARLVSLDFETYFDGDYTLKKMSTSEYIRDPRFKAQMVGIKVGSKKTLVVTGKRIQAELAKINWGTHSLLCHNTHFDGLILSHHFGIIPAKYYCSLSMARGLHSNEIGAGLDEVAKFYGGEGKIDGVLEKTRGVLDWDKQLVAEVTPYCARDVDEMHRVFRLMHAQYPADEIELIHMTMRMFCAPVLRVDIPRVEVEYQREYDRRQELLLNLLNPREYEGILSGPDKKLEGEERDIRIVKKVVSSNERFVDLFEKLGIARDDLPRKISPAWMKKSKEEREEAIESKWSFAFAKDDLEFLAMPGNVWQYFAYLDPNNPDDVHEAAELSERLQQLIDTRIAVKSTTNITRAERFLKAGADGMRLPVGYAYYRAHTGRFGGNNKMNMQNLTRGGELRLSILADKGHAIAVADSGQIEARVNGWLWDQGTLLDAFRVADQWDKSKGVARGANRDAYCRFADGVYGREITTENSLERFVGKVCVLGLGYQMGAPKFQLTLAKGALGGPPVNFPLDECHRIVQLYRRDNFKIAEGWKICSSWIEHMADPQAEPIFYKCLEIGHEYINLPNGMRLKYPDLRKAVGEKGWDEWSYQSGAIRKKIYGGLLCENLVQALARIIVMEQMLMIDAKYPVVMTTHDEVVAHPKLRVADKCYEYMHRCMTTPLWWCQDIPLAAEGGWALNYSK